MSKIKIYTSMDEVNKVHKYREFEVVEKLPEIGEEYDHWQYKVVEVKELQKDCEQGSLDAFNYDIFEVVGEDLTEPGDTEYYDYRYFAIEKAV